VAFGCTKTIGNSKWRLAAHKQMKIDGEIVIKEVSLCTEGFCDYTTVCCSFATVTSQLRLHN